MVCNTPPGPETVVLIHGLWMHGLVLLPLQRRLERKGFAVRRFSYASWGLGLDANVAALAEFIAATPGDRIHLAGHSLGGLLALALLARGADPRIGRLLLLGTPYAGCRSGFWLGSRPLLSRLLGRCLAECLIRPPAAAPAQVQVGVLAGTRRWGLGRLLVPGLASPNDGVVCAAETRYPGARDSIELPVSHSGMLFSPCVAGQVAAFLEKGHFIHA